MQILLILLRKYWPLVVGAIILATATSWHYAMVRAADRAGYRRAMDAVQEERRAETERFRRVSERTANGYQEIIDSQRRRLDELRDRPAAPIRVCKPAAQVRIPAASAVSNAAPTERGSSDEAGPDIRPRLVSYAGDCERLRQQVIALQTWIADVAQ